jgi:hypothetical protein
VSGTVRLKLDDEEVELGPLDAVRIPVLVTRGVAAGPEGGEIVMFGAPDTDNKDLEMVPGFYT